MSTVTRREQRATEVMEPLMSGDYREATIEQAHGWRCDGCGLVWEKRWHADTCESRGHKTSFEQGPYGVRYVENGIPKGSNIRYYTRRAFRREKVATAVPAAAYAHRVESSFKTDLNCSMDQCGGKPGPSHTGSSYCRSGSLASGGNRPHCSCETCF